MTPSTNTGDVPAVGSGASGSALAATTEELVAECRELREWVTAEEEPIGIPRFVSTRLYIKERKQARMALECALDYAQHMAPEDASAIREAHARLGYLCRWRCVDGAVLMGC